MDLPRPVHVLARANGLPPDSQHELERLSARVDESVGVLAARRQHLAPTSALDHLLDEDDATELRAANAEAAQAFRDPALLTTDTGVRRGFAGLITEAELRGGPTTVATVIPGIQNGDLVRWARLTQLAEREIVATAIPTERRATGTN